MTDALSEWLPRDEWDALVRGEGCPLCAAVVSTEPGDEHGYTVADLRFGRLRLGANQFNPGYCVLICLRHAIEPYHLDPAERALFFDDLMWAARAIERAFHPIKLNFELLGNAVPHLHCHLKPRYYGDPCPARPLDLDRYSRLLTPAEYADMAERLRAALDAEASR